MVARQLSVTVENINNKGYSRERIGRLLCIAVVLHNIIDPCFFTSSSVTCFLWLKWRCYWSYDVIAVYWRHGGISMGIESREASISKRWLIAVRTVQ